jgi:hypothetical protein
MTTYKGINGFAVQSVGSDPSPLNEGQVWYNNASYAFKLAVLQLLELGQLVELWDTARYTLVSGAGTSNTCSFSFWWIYWSTWYNYAVIQNLTMELLGHQFLDLIAARRG